ncbi:hypothetical protein KEM48_006460 [Puccinia striiformis f. sp. tritici PST-130]|nr:hypothetical protein KEM48_006460 [Puccinia striiformis f. sp. tritici PST-130]
MQSRSVPLRSPVNSRNSCVKALERTYSITLSKHMAMTTTSDHFIAPFCLLSFSRLPNITLAATTQVPSGDRLAVAHVMTEVKTQLKHVRNKLRNVPLTASSPDWSGDTSWAPKTGLQDEEIDEAITPLLKVHIAFLRLATIANFLDLDMRNVSQWDQIDARLAQMRLHPILYTKQLLSLRDELLFSHSPLFAEVDHPLLKCPLTPWSTLAWLSAMSASETHSHIDLDSHTSKRSACHLMNDIIHNSNSIDHRSKPNSAPPSELLLDNQPSRINDENRVPSQNSLPKITKSNLIDRIALPSRDLNLAV